MKRFFPKRITPRVLAILIGLLSLAMPLVLLSVALFKHQSDRTVFLLFSLLSIFIVNFVMISYVLNSFIIKRITPIYGKIEEMENLDDEFFRMEDRDMIGDLDEKVMQWAKNKALENKRLRENDIVRKEFVGNVAHELKTPVFNIQGYIDTLLDGGIDDKEINMKYLQRTEKNVNRLIATIKDIDTISRLESGRVMIDFEKFDIVNLLHEVVEMQERLTRKFQVELVFEEPVSPPVYVLGDQEKVYELLHNLITNSIKYGKPGGKSVISMREENEKIWVKVRDNGIGIAAEHLPHIFSRFYRVDKSRSRDRGGSGLGLAIVKHIVEAHNETITVNSKVDKGTVFEVSLESGES